MSLLSVKDLHTSFFTDAGEVKAVNGVSYSLYASNHFIGESADAFLSYIY